MQADRPRTSNLLIIDDDRTLCAAIADFFKGHGLKVHVAHSGANGLAVCAKERIDIVLLDQNLPDAEGHALCGAILHHNDRTKIIFITAYPTFDNALKAIKGGAFDYLSKPFELDELEHVIKQSLRTLQLEQVELLEKYREGKVSETIDLIGDSEQFLEVRHLAKLAATSDAPVLITGETGTGKNFLAKHIHFKSNATPAAFINVNCAAIAENLIEAELFGHEKGAFTGAVAMKKGVFEMAEGGTIFLDEIGDMPLALQSKLLSVLDEKQVRRLGGETSRKVDFRVIAATNTRIEEAIGLKKFREDLYYRLSVIRIHIPPLRERRQDIAALCSYLVQKLEPSGMVAMPSEEIQRLIEYHWPGNVRELRNIIERSIILRRDNQLRPSELIETAPANKISKAPQPTLEQTTIPTLAEIQKNHIQMALDHCSHNYTHTAKALGISLSTLKRKLKAYDLT